MKNIFKKFCKQHPFSICEECGVHFEPAAIGERRWGHLCSIHRKTVMEHDHMLDSVASWAKRNWKVVKPMMDKALQEMQSSTITYAEQQEAINRHYREQI